MMLAEKHRRALTLTLAHVGWWGALIFTALAVDNAFPRPVGTIVIVFVGVAIAASLSLSRMRMTDTIAKVFEAGLSAAVVLQASIDARTCVIEADHAGVIETAENSEAIGWRNGDLTTQPVADLVPDGAGRAELAARFSPGAPTSGRTMILPILAANGQSSMMRVTVARVGELHVATITPFKQRRGDLAGDPPSVAKPARSR